MKVSKKKRTHSRIIKRVIVLTLAYIYSFLMYYLGGANPTSRGIDLAFILVSCIIFILAAVLTWTISQEKIDRLEGERR